MVDTLVRQTKIRQNQISLQKENVIIYSYAGNHEHINSYLKRWTPAERECYHILICWKSRTHQFISKKMNLVLKLMKDDITIPPLLSVFWHYLCRVWDLPFLVQKDNIQATEPPPCNLQIDKGAKTHGVPASFFTRKIKSMFQNSMS